MKDNLPVRLFRTRKEWETWLREEPSSSAGVWVKFAKKGAAEASLSKQEALDEALCHGWIDGQIRPLDESYWLVRFVPRAPRSKWSLRNRERAEELIRAGRMQARGTAEVERAKADGRWEAAYASQSRITVPDDLAQALKAHSKAADFFGQLDSANRYAILYRVTEAKKPETQARWIERVIGMLERGETFHAPRKAKVPKR